MEKGYIFVYGTLKVGGYFALQFDEYRISSIPATAKGTMYEASGWFPAVIFDDEREVIGELHEYEDIDRVLRYLDYIEGCDPEGGSQNLYNRHIVEVTTENGDLVKAHTYEYNRETEDLKIRESGIWPIKEENTI